MMRLYQVTYEKLYPYPWILRLESLYIKNALIIDCLKKNRERVHQSEERQTKSDTPTSHHFSYKGKLSLFKIISTCKSVN